MRLATILVAVGLALLIAAPAGAQDNRRETEARRVFEAGQAAFDDARYGDALVHFRRAHNLSHRPALLFNIGLCADRLRDDDAAIEAYERYLAEVPSAPNRREVNGRLEALHRAQRRRAAAAQTVRRGRVTAAADNTPVSHEATATATVQVAARDTAPQAQALYEKWWFWTIVGVVVVGSAVGIGVAASGDAPLQAGNVGGVVFTLGGAR